MILCSRATGVTSKVLSEVLFPGCDISIKSSNPSCSLYICGSPFFPVFFRTLWFPFKQIFSFTCLKWIMIRRLIEFLYQDGQSQLFAWVQAILQLLQQLQPKLELHWGWELLRKGTKHIQNLARLKEVCRRLVMLFSQGNFLNIIQTLK